MGWCGVDWIDMAQNRDPGQVLVKTLINLQIPSNVGKFFSDQATDGFSRTQLHGVS
jgi:hypothetical protein